MASQHHRPQQHHQMSEADAYAEQKKAKFARKQHEQQLRQKKYHQFVSSVYVGARYPDLAESEDIGEVLNQLTSAEQIHLQHLHNDYGNDHIASIVLAPNTSPTDIGGHVLTFNADAPIQIKDAINMDTPFSHTAIVAVPQLDHLSEKELRAQYADKLAAALSDVGTTGPTIGTHCGGYYDRADWPFFFPEGSTAGLYKRNDGSEGTFLIVSSHAGKEILADLHQVCGEKDMTAGQFAQDQRVSWCRQMSMRNCCGLLHKIAAVIDCPIRWMKDMWQFLFSPTSVPRRLACPDSVTVSNTCATTREGDVACYHRTINPFQSQGEDLLMHAGPMGGYHAIDRDYVHPFTDIPFYPDSTDIMPIDKRMTAVSEKKHGKNRKKFAHHRKPKGEVTHKHMYTHDSFNKRDYSGIQGLLDMKTPPSAATFVAAAIYVH